VKTRLDYSISIAPSDSGLDRGWEIYEHDGNGNPVSQRGLIPWDWSLHFDVHDLQCVSSFQSSDSDESSGDRGKLEVIEQIVGTLNPVLSEYRQEPKISMLGSRRIISQYGVSFFQISDDQHENCQLRGVVERSTGDWGDCIEMFVYLGQKNFAGIRTAVLNRQLESVSIVVSQCQGLYAYWSPEIYAEVVKVLCDVKDQQVDDPYGLMKTLPELGSVGNFFLRTKSKKVCSLERQAKE
jgi:hypothetical protein